MSMRSEAALRPTGLRMHLQASSSMAIQVFQRIREYTTSGRIFSPRLGLAWDVKGDGRTSVRASVGTFYDFPHTHYQYDLSAEPPFLPRYQLTSINWENPWAAFPGGDPLPQPFGRGVGRNAPFGLQSIITAIDYNSPNMRVNQWNLSVQ